MRIAITGGTGFVGRHLAPLLSARGHEVVALSRRTGQGVEDTAALREAFAGCDAVVHCAGINRESGRQTYANVHVQGTRNVVEAAHARGVAKLVTLSFLRARPDCGSGYHESKWQAEELTRASGLDFTVVKAGVIGGHGDHLISHLSRTVRTLPVFGLLGKHPTPIAPVDVHDLAHVLAAAVEDSRLSDSTVAVTGPEELTLRAFVERVHRAVEIDAGRGSAPRRAPRFLRLPLAAHYVLAWLQERVMVTPLISLAQVRILAEGLVEPTPGTDRLPEDLLPSRALTVERLHAGFPDRARFGWRDLRVCRG